LALKAIALALSATLLAPAGGAGPARPKPKPSPAAAGDALASPRDEAYRQALEQLYDGDAEGALERLVALNRSQPDPIGAYLEALVVCWRLEQRLDASLDKDFLKASERARALAESRLQKDPDDLRALFARGAAHGVESRYHLFRLHRREAARAAARMREDLLAVRRQNPAGKDALFGVGLYDYYADVLPRIVKVLRFFTGIPGGDRQRGLLAIEEAHEGSLFHQTEVQVQLYEIYAFYDKRPDRALAEMRALRRRYPHWPLWGLKLAEHLRDRMGLYGESADVARELLRAGEAGDRHYTGVAGAMARMALGEALLLDLRTAEARQELLAVREVPGAPPVAARARVLLGRSLELEGDRDGAVAHYRLAAQSSERSLKKEAENALDKAMPAAQVRSWQLIGQARRLREANRRSDALEKYRLALRAWPASKEAALAVAEGDLRRARADEAAAVAAAVADADEVQPAWLSAWARLLLAQARDLDGQREAARKLYQQVVEAPCGQEELRLRAREGLRRPFAAENARAAPGQRN
jgi:hypothetical protein